MSELDASNVEKLKELSDIFLCPKPVIDSVVGGFEREQISSSDGCSVDELILTSETIFSSESLSESDVTSDIFPFLISVL